MPRATPFTDTYWTNCQGRYDGQKRRIRTSSPTTARAIRSATRTGARTPPNLVTGCDVFFDAIGDLDYDGTSYYADWPTSTEPGRFPGTTPQAQPTSQGRTYPQIQFETDLAATEFRQLRPDDRRRLHGAAAWAGPLLPVLDARKRPQLGCTWQFGNAGAPAIRSAATRSTDGDFSPPGAFTSEIQPNPSCSVRSG